MREKIIKMWHTSGIGFYVSWGTNYERRRYISIDIPFYIIQIFLDK